MSEPDPQDPAQTPQPVTDLPAAAAERCEGGDGACWAHLVCPGCGAVVSEGHRPGCASVAQP